MQPLM